MSETKSRFRVLTDHQWETIETLLPSSDGRRGRPFRNSRLIVEGIIYRYRTGIPWRDLPREEYGPWQTVWKRHRRYSADGTWDRLLTYLLTLADAEGEIDWNVLNRRLHHPCPPARDEHNPTRAGHRGLDRITRIFPWR